MFHPDVELRLLDPRVGFGLVATRRIPRGTVTWALCDLEQVFAPQALARLDEPYRGYLEKYAYTTDLGDHVLCCDVGRYINHSCDPNTLTLPGMEVEVAVRDIEPGEEVTDDYGTLNLPRDMVCLCRSPRCRGHVRPSDRARLAPGWVRQVRAAVREAGRVPQPLRPFLGPDALAAVGLVETHLESA